TLANRSTPLAASARHTISCSAERMLTPSLRRSCNSGHVVDSFRTQTDAIGGASETKVNALADIPIGAPPGRAHNAVTPLGKHEYVRLSSAASVLPSLVRTMGPPFSWRILRSIRFVLAVRLRCGGTYAMH